MIYIEILYVSSNTRVSQGGSFPLRGGKPEQVALQFWKQIKKDMSYHAQIEKITADGEDITQLVKDLENQSLNLPF